jgi:hypothetical protein
MKVRKTDNGSYTFLCPGCNEQHEVYVDVPHHNGSRWGFNGNVDKPTFTPSLVIMTGHYVNGQPQPPNCWLCNEGHNFCYRCHSFITDGKIQFLSDCTHSLANQTVELNEII